MKRIAIGAGVAALIIGAFVLGSGILEEQRDGPAEQLGEKLDNTVGELKEQVQAADK